MTPYEQGYYDTLEKYAGFGSTITKGLRGGLEFIRKGPAAPGKGFFGHTQLSKTLTEPAHRQAAAEMLRSAREASRLYQPGWFSPFRASSAPWLSALGKSQQAFGKLPLRTQRQLLNQYRMW